MRASGLAVTFVIQLRVPATVGGRYSCTYSRFSCEVESALIVQQSQVTENVLLDFFGRGLRIDFLQVRNDLLNTVFAVATRDDFKARTIQTKGALGHEENALLIVFPEAAARRKARI
jgi:hypothetical protein